LRLSDHIDFRAVLVGYEVDFLHVVYEDGETCIRAKCESVLRVAYGWGEVTDSGGCREEHVAGAEVEDG